MIIVTRLNGTVTLPQVCDGGLAVSVYNIAEAFSFTRATAVSPPNSTMTLRPSSVYRVNLGVRLQNVISPGQLMVRARFAEFRRGVVVERIELESPSPTDTDGTLIAFVSIRGTDPVILSASEGHQFEVYSTTGIIQCSDAVSIADPINIVAPPKITSIKITPPIRGNRPMGAPKATDAELQDQFMKESDDVKAFKTSPMAAPSYPQLRSRVLDENLNPTSSFKDIPDSRVGHMNATGDVVGGPTSEAMS